MFTIEQIGEAHRKVKSGADFPAYIQDLKKLGVRYYETFVVDGHTDYYGANDFKTTSPAKYGELKIDGSPNEEQFKTDLIAHQQGETDYPQFCADAAKSGIEKWVVHIKQMACIYFDKTGNKVLSEKIPE